MSAQATRRDAYGVLLRYSLDAAAPARSPSKFEHSDRLRMAVLRAEKAVTVLSIIARHLEISYLGMERVADALDTIDEALELARAELGLSVATKESG